MERINDASGLIIDMDGVLWLGNNPIAGLATFFSTLREIDIPFVLATNNASLTQQQYINKLTTMGVTVTADEILTSSMATASYLAQHQPENKRRVFIIGEDGKISFAYTNTDYAVRLHPDVLLAAARVYKAEEDKRLRKQRKAQREAEKAAEE